MLKIMTKKTHEKNEEYIAFLAKELTITSRNLVTIAESVLEELVEKAPNLTIRNRMVKRLLKSVEGMESGADKRFLKGIFTVQEPKKRGRKTGGKNKVVDTPTATSGE